MRPVVATYYDGLSARPQPVSIFLHDGRLIVDGEAVARDEPLAGLSISEPLGAAPRVVRFADGAHCEVRDHAVFAELLHAAGIGDGLVVRLQARWHWALAAVVLTVAAALAGYRWGLPAAADWAAERLPQRLLAGMGESTLAIFDAHLFEASTLTDARQAQLATAFARLTPPTGTAPVHRIMFRDGGPIGANAFALPDGTIVVTDQLVAMAGHDEEILGVLAHELGHLDRRHSLRMLIQGSIVGFMVGWYLGDVSSVAAGLPSALLQARYSRDFEREADDYALHMLEHNGIPPAALARLLEHMQALRDSAYRTGGDPLRGYLSSHPATRERIERLDRANDDFNSRGQRSVAPAARIVAYGIMQPETTVLEETPETTSGYSMTFENISLTRQTNRIPCREGVFFGFEYVITGLPRGGRFALKTVVSHPEMTRPDGEISSGYETVIEADADYEGRYSDSTGYALYRDFELKPGTWDFRLYYRDNLLVEREFTVYEEQPH